MVLLQNDQRNCYQKKKKKKKKPSDDRRKYEQKNYVFAFFVLKNLQLIVKVKCEIKEKMSELFKKATKICLFKKLLFTMENATAADSSQSNISRIYI